LIMTSRPIGPAAFGLIRPTVLMPETLLSSISPDAVDLILAHELIHVRRGDIIAGKLQLLTQLIWWFHPLVWWANREANGEREHCCDAEVVSGMHCRPVLYARALLSVVEQKCRLRPLPAIAGVRALEVTSRRLESIMRYADFDLRRASWLPRIVFAAGMALLVPGMGLTLRANPHAQDRSPGTAQSAPEKSTNAKTAGLDETRPKGNTTDGLDVNARRRAQRKNTIKAEAAYRNATLERELAEIAMVEYQEGIFKQDLATVDGEIKLAESNVKRSEDRLAWARRMFTKGYLPKSGLVSAEQALKKARFALEQAQSKWKVLVQYTKAKTIKELKSEVEKARAEELAKRTTWEREKSKEQALEREIARPRATSGNAEPR
jgi:hypothetical protein